jgi:hypothetical protein
MLILNQTLIALLKCLNVPIPSLKRDIPLPSFLFIYLLGPSWTGTQRGAHILLWELSGRVIELLGVGEEVPRKVYSEFVVLFVGCYTSCLIVRAVLIELAGTCDGNG